jgi:hypothetical protein
MGGGSVRRASILGSAMASLTMMMAARNRPAAMNARRAVRMRRRSSTVVSLDRACARRAIISGALAGS